VQIWKNSSKIDFGILFLKYFVVHAKKFTTEKFAESFFFLAPSYKNPWTNLFGARNEPLRGTFSEHEPFRMKIVRACVKVAPWALLCDQHIGPRSMKGGV
jgi:hypothetical protein